MKNMYKARLTMVIVFGSCIGMLHRHKHDFEKDLLGQKSRFLANAYIWCSNSTCTRKFPDPAEMTTRFYPDYVEKKRLRIVGSWPRPGQMLKNGRLKKEKLDAIEKACQAVMDGKYHDQFWWLYQGGAGTSANMNANEVLANIALELSGHKKGEYQFIEPHDDDLNMGQSTNDTYPTAIKKISVAAA